MIASLRGEVIALKATGAVIECGGIGMAFSATPTALSKLRLGEEAFVHVAMVVSREGEIALFGFSEADEKEVFEKLRSVSGIGPRSALQILAALPPDALRAAVQNKDESALVRVPGIGKKSAQRLILELSGKLGEVSGGAAPTAAGTGDVIEALVSMGWPERDAAPAVAAAAEESADKSTAGLLRAALIYLGQRR